VKFFFFFFELNFEFLFRKYKSVKESEHLDEYHLVKTAKELYCRICNVYDCYHGIQKSDNFMGLHQEKNCNFQSAEFFARDFDDAKLLCENNARDMSMREIFQNLKHISLYFKSKVLFICKNNCFMDKPYSKICRIIVNFS